MSAGELWPAGEPSSVCSVSLAGQVALQPGRALGPFVLGAPLPEVLALLRSPPHRATYRCVEIKYEQQQSGRGAAPGDLALCLPEHGLHLHFDAQQQRLRLVEVHDTTRLQVRYGGRVFGGAAHAPTFGRICDAFGPTYPGEASAGQYPLQYPGVCFLFPLGGGPDPVQQAAAAAQAALPVSLSTPAARILVHHGAAASPAAARAAPPPPLPRAAAYWERVEAVPGQGLLFASGGQLLRFGDSPQEVVAELGPPSSTHAKAGRPTPGGASGGAAPCVGAAPATAPDYFYCYAVRGVDALFDGGSHRLKKLVLHANQPGHPDFGLYSRCNFRVHAPGTWSLPGSDGGAVEGEESPHATYASAGSDGGASMRTAASETSLAALEAAAAAAANGSGAAAAAHVAGSPLKAPLPQPQQPQPPPHEREAEGKPRAAPGGLSAAYSSLVRMIDGVMHLDESSSPSEGGGGASPTAAAAQADATAGGAGAAALGRPPRPPTPATSLPIPTPPPAASAKGGSSKKKKKKERQRAAAAAKLAGGGGGGDESATDTDASFADSAPSSLASSPGMTSFLSNIAATGGSARVAAASGAPPAALAAHALASGAASEASSADFAGKERRVEGGSAFDGWSEGEELALLVGGEEAGGGGGSVQHPAAAAATQQPAAAQQQAQAQVRRVTTAVQTAPADDAEMAAFGASQADASVAGPDSPDSFVLTDSPALFDESAADYESVPLQRSSGTQTQPHLLAGPALHGGAGGGAHRRGGAAAAAAAASAAAAVGVASGVAGLQAAFGAGAKPALHTRLGGRHPFGPTHLLAYRGAVFEVLHSGAIATVTLFEA